MFFLFGVHLKFVAAPIHDREKSRVCSSHSNFSFETIKVVALIPECGWCKGHTESNSIPVFPRSFQELKLQGWFDRYLLEFSSSWHGLKPFLI
jgi:hypothetical protein